MTPEGHVCVRLEVCDTCVRLGTFAAIGITCAKCRHEYAPGTKQPPLRKLSERPLVYAVDAVNAGRKP